MEIDDGEYQRLSAARTLLYKLLTPKTKRKTEALIKEHFPDTVTTEDLDPPELKETRAELTALRKEFKDYLDAQRLMSEDTATNAAFSRLADAGRMVFGRDYRDVHGRNVGHAHNLVAIEIGLLDYAVLDGDALAERCTEPERHRAHHLCFDVLRLHHRARIDRRPSERAGSTRPARSGCELHGADAINPR